MQLAKRLKKYRTSRKVRAMLGERPPITDASKLSTFLGYTPGWWIKRKPAKQPGVIHAMNKFMAGLKRQEAIKASLLSRIKRAVRDRFQRKAGGK